MAKSKAATASASPQSTTSSAAASRRSGRSCKARSLACRECRDRKIRCDGGRPTCDSCRRRGLGADQCVYPEIEHDGSIASSRSYIRVLQKRVQELEAREQQLLAGRTTHPSASSSPLQDDAWAKPFTSPNAVPLQPKPANPTDQVLPPIHSEILGFPPAVPGSLPMLHEPASNYYSHNSPPLTDDLEDASPIKSSFGSYSTNVKAAIMLEKIALPATELMDDLLSEYFELDWTTMPIIHRPSFVERYNRLTAVANSRYRRDIPLAEATDLATTFSLLLGMLATGHLSKHATPTATEMATASEFHEQAKALLLSDLISAPSLQVVQALIIHARFLRRCGMMQDSWVMNGLAQRLAEGLLLHLDLPTKSVSEREERRRTWCACVLSLRMQNVAHGGTSATSSPNFGALPAEIDYEMMDSQPQTSGGSQTPEAPCWTSFFVQMLKLSDSVLQPIQQIFFGSSQTHDDKKGAMPEILSAALRLDGELQDWHNSLPRHLQVDSICSQGQMGLRRQALLLHMRYLETKVLLSRAAIMKLVQGHPGKQLTAMSKALLGGIIDVVCTSSNELVDLMAREKDLLVLAGTPQSHVAISFCITGMTLSMLLKMPILQDLIRNPAMYADDIRHCLSLGKQFYTARDEAAERYIQVFEAAVQVQPQPRFPVSPGVVDPALEAKTLPALRGDVATANAAELGGTEMAMLEAWYRGRPEMLGSLGGFCISEILTLW